MFPHSVRGFGEIPGLPVALPAIPGYVTEEQCSVTATAALAAGIEEGSAFATRKGYLFSAVAAVVGVGVGYALARKGGS